MNITLLRVNPPTEKRLRQDISNPIPAPINVRHQMESNDPFDRTKWRVRLSLGRGQLVAENLGRFIYGCDANNRRTQEDSRSLVANIWTLAEEVAEQVAENRRSNERIAVYMDNLIPAVTTTELENMGADLG